MRLLLSADAIGTRAMVARKTPALRSLVIIVVARIGLVEVANADMRWMNDRVGVEQTRVEVGYYVASRDEVDLGRRAEKGENK